MMPSRCFRLACDLWFTDEAMTSSIKLELLLPPRLSPFFFHSRPHRKQCVHSERPVKNARFIDIFSESKMFPVLLYFSHGKAKRYSSSILNCMDGQYTRSTGIPQVSLPMSEMVWHHHKETPLYLSQKEYVLP